MGLRTVVVLNNDRSREWENDPELGKKIMRAGSMVSAGYGDTARREFLYGEVVEQVHADVQTLIVADGYGGKHMVRTYWYRNQSNESRDLELLRKLAEKMGYNLHKKPAKK